MTNVPARRRQHAPAPNRTTRACVSAAAYVSGDARDGMVARRVGVRRGAPAQLYPAASCPSSASSPVLRSSCGQASSAAGAPIARGSIPGGTSAQGAYACKPVHRPTPSAHPQAVQGGLAEAVLAVAIGSDKHARGRGRGRGRPRVRVRRGRGCKPQRAASASSAGGAEQQPGECVTCARSRHAAAVRRAHAHRQASKRGRPDRPWVKGGQILTIRF